MLTTESDGQLVLWLGLWLVTVFAILVIRARRHARGVGLIESYLALLWMNHWLAAMIYTVPGYLGNYSLGTIKAGFEQSLLGLIGFGLGAAWLGPAFVRAYRNRLSRPAESSQETPTYMSDQHVPRIYLILGVLGYFVLAPLAGTIPSFGTIATNLGSLLLVGIILLWWQAWQAHRWRWIGFWFLVILSWPLLTVTTQGFLGAGFSMLVIALIFAARAIGLRRWMPLAGLVFLFIFLSVYVTYMRDRTEIRDVVWSDSGLEERVTVVSESFGELELFDLGNTDHLDLIDVRINLDSFVGLAAQRLQGGYVDYARGDTLVSAVAMIIPRVVWPDKPIRLGGAELVTKYTGIAFYGSTSSSLGHVGEFYINFGTLGVFLGLFLMGFLLSVLDDGASRSLRRGNWAGFAQWYLPALSLLLVDNWLIAATGGSVSALITIILVNRFILPFVLRSSSRQISISQHKGLSKRL